MDINTNQFYIMQFIHIINYVILCTLLIEPLRFSKKITCVITFIGFFILYLPQLCFPSFFYNKIDSNTIQFILNTIYWSAHVFVSYGIIFLLLRRNWLHNYFYLILWDIIASIILAILTPLQFIFSNLWSILPYVSSIFSIFIIRKIFKYRFPLPQRFFYVLFILYTLFRIAFTLGGLNAAGTTGRTLLQIMIFIVSLLFLITISLMNKIVNYYIIRKCDYYQDLFHSSSMSSSTDELISYLKRQWKSMNTSLEVHNHLSDIYFHKNFQLYYLLILCNEILVYCCKDIKKPPINVYINIQQQMNYIIVSTGCIQSDSDIQFDFTNRFLLSLKEFLLTRLIQTLHGQIQFLDDDIHHTQIQIAYLS